MSGWQVHYVRRWRLYPTWMPWGVRRVTSYVGGGNFTYM